MIFIQISLLGAVAHDNEHPLFVDFGSMPQESMTFQQLFPQLFQLGLAQQKEKKWDDAIAKYKSLLDQGRSAITDEQGSVVFHNMAVCAFEKSDFTNAYVWSKKATTLNSGNTFAHNLFIEVSKKFQPAQVPHQISAVESLQKVALKNVSFDPLLAGFLVFLFFAIFSGLKLWLSRKKDQIESENLSMQKKQPITAWIGVSLLTLLTAVFLFLAIIKWDDLSLPKALISAENTSVQTAAGGGQATIYDASVGLEVDVLKIQGEFVQVRYPGAFSGWVAKKNLEIISSSTWP